MIKLKRYLICILTAFLVGTGIQLSFGQGPLTGALNLRVRTDANGYLLVSSGSYSAADGPLTNFGNIRLRTDSNGYLMIAFGAGGFSTPGSVTAGTYLIGTIGVLPTTNANGIFASPADGVFTFTNNVASIGSRIKTDSLPTVASGFGTSPAVTAGSTAFAGSINVGTGAPGTGGVINFNGTAYPSAPFVICQDDSTLLTVRCTASTTQLTIAATALTASDVVSWITASAK